MLFILDTNHKCVIIKKSSRFPSTCPCGYNLDKGHFLTKRRVLNSELMILKDGKIEKRLFLFKISILKKHWIGKIFKLEYLDFSFLNALWNKSIIVSKTEKRLIRRIIFLKLDPCLLRQQNRPNGKSHQGFLHHNLTGWTLRKKSVLN